MRDERAEGLRWLRQAENDLEFGRLALREGYFAQARFIAQQSAAKAPVEHLRDRFPALFALRKTAGGRWLMAEV